MTYQYSVAVRNAKLDTVESTIGTAALLRLFSGAEPDAQRMLAHFAQLTGAR